VKLAALLVVALTAACTLGHASSTSSVGDQCMVGTWTEVDEVNVSAYSINNESLSVAGFKGSGLTISSDGAESLSFDSSEPLIGTTKAGARLVITIRGKATFHIRGDGHMYSETGSKVTLATEATLNGKPVSYQSSYAPGHGTYTCDAHSLVTVSAGGVQTDTWSR
jgi:hypothetical protein